MTTGSITLAALRRHVVAHQGFATRLRKAGAYEVEGVWLGGEQYGLLPIENTTAGSINETYDLFLKHGLHLVAEIPRTSTGKVRRGAFRHEVQRGSNGQ